MSSPRQKPGPNPIEMLWMPTFVGMTTSGNHENIISLIVSRTGGL